MKLWFLFRPDATNVWKDQKVVQRYQRYRDILDGKKTARYLIAKKVSVDIAVDSSLEELWKSHEKATTDFNEIIQKIDTETLSVNDLPKPKVSFVDLKEKIANEILRSCHFCERRCKKDRNKGETGHCKLGKESYISSAFLHTGEESILVPSGTIFFTGCTFNCVFCQNHDISQGWCDDKKQLIGNHLQVDGNKVAILAERLWKEGAKNINLVGGDPTPNLHTIISALNIFDKNITILWNSNMYQSNEATMLLLELMDFWLPDLKFWDNDFAKKMSGVNNYQEIVTRNIKMVYEKGSGEVLVRHLIMPGRVEKDTYPILEWCAKEIPKSMINLMDQYHPDYLVNSEPSVYSAINRRITQTEWQKATKKADELEIFWRPVS
jgi:putative pyruvate formate lyase activating enzyme